MDKIIYTDKESVNDANNILKDVIKRLNDNVDAFNDFNIEQVRAILKADYDYKAHYIYRQLIAHDIKAKMEGGRCKYTASDYADALCQHLSTIANERYNDIDNLMCSIRHHGSAVKAIADCIDRKDDKFVQTKDAKTRIETTYSLYIHSERAERALKLCEQMRTIMKELNDMDVNWRSAIPTLDMLNYSYFVDL